MADAPDKLNKNQNTLDVANGKDERNYLQEELYKKNVELHFVNEFLSLTRELYSISLLSLGPTALSEKITSVIREKLEFEMAGVFVWKHDEDILEPLYIAKSDLVTGVMRKMNFRFREIKITEASKRPALKSLFDGKQLKALDLASVWGGLVKPEDLETISKESNIKAVLLYPLLTEERFIGVFFLALHSSFEELPEIERDQLKTFSDIIAVSLDKAYAYKKLSEVNQSLVSANIDLLKANEELKTVDATKSAILSSASHHLQNPLQNMVMGTSMLLDGSYGTLTPEAKKTVAGIFESARHLTITLKMWLKALDFENNRVEYKFEIFNLSEFVQRIIKEWKVSAGERGLQIFFETDQQEPYTINADKEWIREVVINLVDNALKMTEKGFVKIRVEKNGVEKVRLLVEDTGVGISEETMLHLFNKFEKGKEGWKKDIYGTGLGLYICKKIIEDGHDGKISALSKGPNKGAIFTVELSAGSK